MKRISLETPEHPFHWPETTDEASTRSCQHRSHHSREALHTSHGTGPSQPLRILLQGSPLACSALASEYHSESDACTLDFNATWVPLAFEEEPNHHAVLPTRRQTHQSGKQHRHQRNKAATHRFLNDERQGPTIQDVKTRLKLCPISVHWHCLRDCARAKLQRFKKLRNLRGSAELAPPGCVESLYRRKDRQTRQMDVQH